MNKFYYILALLLSFSPVIVSAQDIQLNVSDSVDLTTESGKTVTIPIIVKSEIDGAYSARIDLPEGWHSLGMEDGLQLVANEPHLSLVTVNVPSGAEYGDYEIRYSVGNEHRTESVTIPVTIQLHLEVAVEYEPIRERVLVSSNQIETTFLIHNKSNVRDVINIDLQDRLGRSQVETPQIELGPNEIREVRVTTSLEDWEIRSSTSHFLKLEVTSARDNTVSDITGVRREVFPTLDGGDLAYHEFPVITYASVGFEEYGRRSDWVYQIGASGGGTYTEDGLDGVDFIFVAPDQRDKASSIIPVYDRYTVNFYGEQYVVNLGDQHFTRDPLMGYSYADFGAGAGYSFDRYGVYGYVAKNRRFRIGAQEVGAQFSFNPTNTWQNSLNFKYSETDIDLADGHVATYSTTYQPFKELVTRGGIGLSESDSGTDLAARAEGVYSGEKLRFNLRGEYFGNDYASFNRGLKSVYGNVNYTFNRDWSTYASSNFVDRESLQNYRYIMSTVGARYKRLNAYYSNSFRKRVGLLPQSRGEDLIGLRYSYSIRNIGGSIFSEYAWLTDYRDDTNSDRYKIGLSGTYQPVSDLRLHGTVSYENGARLYSLNDGDVVQVLSTFGVDYRFMENTRFRNRISYYHYNTDGIDESRNNWRFRSSINHILPWQHEIELEGFYYNRSRRDFNNYGAAFTYIAPFNIPLHRSRKTGMVEGVIIERNTGVGISDVTVFLEDAGVATNEAGQFFIPNQSPGNYTLTVDQLGLGLGYIILDQDAVREVEVRPGEVTFVSIEAVQAAEVRGMVMLERGDTFESVGNIEETENEPLSNVVIELVGNDILRRRITDENGTFRVGSIPPGEYNISIIQDFLPDLHEAENNEYRITIAPGDVHDIEFLVKPVKRRIQFINDDAESIKIGSAPTTAEEALATGDYIEYTVKPGDWLSKLAIRYYHDMNEWPLIFDRNTDVLVDPNLIYPGQVLVIPIEASEGYTGSQ